MDDNDTAEVMRLKGELSCATHVIALLYNLDSLVTSLCRPN